MIELSAYPFIQTHTFHVEPYVSRTQGYAPFIACPIFTGSERVKFHSVDGALLPDTKTSERTLTEFANGKWFLGDAERVKSATSGSLEMGKYRFIIEGPDEIAATVDLDYEPRFINPVTVTVNEGSSEVEVSWSKTLNVDNFWLFIVPVGTRNFFDDLLPVTENKYLEQAATLSKRNLRPGTYRCAVRANEMVKAPGVSGFLSEAWGISETVFRVP